MKMHTTKAGDQFLQTHIADATPWSREAYRPPSRELPADRATRYFTISAAMLGILGLAVIVIHLFA